MKFFTPSADIARALKLSLPIVALESTVITHGLPHPENLYLARDMEAAIRDEGATPATVAILNGQVRVGLIDSEIEDLSKAKAIKVSRRDFATAIIKKTYGGTTVAGTMFVAHNAGIKVFATGGIGGVHRETPFDISTDLQALADTPMIVVCAGAKAILDLPATLEYLETMGIPTIGYQTDEFPAFFSRESGHKVSVRLDNPEDIVKFAYTHWKIGMKTAVLVTQPIAEVDGIAKSEMDLYIKQASLDAIANNTIGQALTPFLLERITELSNGKSLHANISLLLNNAVLAAKIARSFSRRITTQYI